MKNQFSSETLSNHIQALDFSDVKATLTNSSPVLSKTGKTGNVYLAHTFVNKTNKGFSKVTVILTQDILVVDAFKEIRKILSLKKPNKTHMSKLASIYDSIEGKCMLQDLTLGTTAKATSLNYNASSVVVKSMSLSHESIQKRFKTIFRTEGSSTYHKAVNPIILASKAKLDKLMDEFKALSNSYSKDMDDSAKAELKLAKLELSIKGSELVANTIAEMTAVIADMTEEVNISYHYKYKTFLVFDHKLFSFVNPTRVKAKA